MSNERRDRRLRENERESRTHRSSSHRHRSNETHKHDHDRRHRRHRHRRRIPHPEMEPRSSTHIYFNGSASNVPSVSVHTDHVTLASSLNSFNEGMDTLLDNCFELLGRLRKNPIVYSGNSQQTSSNGKRGVNHSNLAAVPTSQKPKPVSFSGILETFKTCSTVPATETKAQLIQSLVSHTEAKLDVIDISLTCPLTRSRMLTPVRGRNCTHVSCFDGEAYLRLMWEKRVEKWKCPICKTLTPLSELVIDGFIQGILESVPEDMKSVEFTPEGFWRIKEGSESFLPIKKSSVDCYSDSNQQNTFIDLTFDTPPKIVPKKISNGDENCGGSNPQIQVIDLTVSP